MRLVLQRVSEASVTIDGQTKGSIGNGLVVFFGAGEGDTTDDLGYLVDKTLQLRIFPDEDGKMNRSLEDAGGEILVISQFTLYANPHKGRRPSFNEALNATDAEQLYNAYVEGLKEAYDDSSIETGEFGEMMDVDLVNDGPVTILIDSEQQI
jgi:D-tyrosyl-tRNA(Tyr) deacylase